MTRQDALFTLIAAAAARSKLTHDELCTVLRSMNRLGMKPADFPQLFLLLGVSDRDGNFFPQYESINQSRRQQHEDVTNPVL
jgi:hypothetical protein